MSIKINKLFISTIIISQIFISTINNAFADAIILDKEKTEGVNVRENKDNDSNILGGIEDFSIYQIKGEDDNWYEIDFDGKTGYVGKSWFYRLNHTSIIAKTNLKSEPDSDSSNAIDYKLQEQSKVTILEFIKDSDFVKVSYDESFSSNRKINVTDINKLVNNELLYDLADHDSEVKTVTLDDNENIQKTPRVVTLDEAPQTVTMDSDSNEQRLDEPVIGYVKLSSLAVSLKDETDLKEFIKSYDDMNTMKKEREDRDKALINQTREIQETHYQTITTYHTSNDQDPTSTIEVPVAGSKVGSDLYNWAIQYVGRPYVLGGVSLTNGIDCSGFTMQIYRQVGIELPHFAQSQQRYGVEIPFGQEQAGDLVFFGSSLNNITHVGMADGYGNMVHASSPRVGIIISPIRNPISIKRIVTD